MADARWASRLADELAAGCDAPPAAAIAEGGLLEWACARRVLGGRPFSLEGHEYLRSLYEDPHPRIVLRKGSQVGASEWALSRSLWLLDRAELVERRARTVIYFFPTDRDVSEFSKLRLTPAARESAYLSACMGVVSRQDTVQQRTMHGRQSILFRGMQSGIRVKSVPADMLVFDELDESPVEEADQAEERLGHSDLGWMVHLSTPTIPGVGIDAEFAQSDQRYWFARCRCPPGCAPDLTWPDCLARDGEGRAFLRCPECRASLDVGRGAWRPTVEHARHGYHLSRLVSGLGDLDDIASWHERGEKQARLLNHKLALPYAGERVPFPREALLACVGEHPASGAVVGEGSRFLGCDVGAVLHASVGLWAGEALRIELLVSLREWSDLAQLMDQHAVATAVVDAGPETLGARSFAARFPGRVWLSRYDHEGEPMHRWDHPQGVVHTNRTMALDDLRDRIRRRQLVFPGGLGSAGPALSAVREAIVHCTHLTRCAVESHTGRLVARYGRTGPDHYAHALSYLLTAASRAGFFWASPRC